MLNRIHSRSSRTAPRPPACTCGSPVPGLHSLYCPLFSAAHRAHLSFGARISLRAYARAAARDSGSPDNAVAKRWLASKAVRS